jgi:small ligand-binding sensory domain FIST
MLTINESYLLQRYMTLDTTCCSQKKYMFKAKFFTSASGDRQKAATNSGTFVIRNLRHLDSQKGFIFSIPLLHLLNFTYSI